MIDYEMFCRIRHAYEEEHLGCARSPQAGINRKTYSVDKEKELWADAECKKSAAIEAGRLQGTVMGSSSRTPIRGAALAPPRELGYTEATRF